MDHKTLTSSLYPVDALILAFIVFLSVLTVWWGGTIHDWPVILALNAAGAAAVITLAAGASARSGRTMLTGIHDWYPVPVIFLLFKEVHVLIQATQRLDWDPILIRADRWLFHGDPTVSLSAVSTPLITEILQIAYASYYFIMVAVGIELFVAKRRKEFSFVVFTIVYGFCLSYIGYLAFPAVGPRFTLHDFRTLDTDLPGLWLTGPIREFLNAGESIPKDVTNALALAQRDAFPSGHTQMTLISLALAVRYRLKSRFILIVLGTLLIISTVYLRYHYVIDLIGGAAFMLLTMTTAPVLDRWWDGLRGPRAEARGNSGLKPREEMKSPVSPG